MKLKLMMVTMMGVFACTLASADPIKVACLGDSNTQESGGTSWPKYMQEMLGKDYSVRNFGQSGTNGAKLGNPWRNTKHFAASTNFAPNVVVWMHGTNDSTHWKKRNLGETYRDDIQELLSQYKALPSKPVIIIANSPSMFQRDPKKIWGINADILDAEVIPAIADIAKGLKAPLVDLHKLTANQADGYVGPDGCHLTDKGKKAVAEAIAAAVKKANVNK